MMEKVKRLADLGPIALLILLPLAGVLLAGKPLTPYLQFPPQTRPAAPTPFLWPVFIAISAFVIASLAPFIIALMRARPQSSAQPQRRVFPWWGWVGLMLTAVAWALAWNPFTPVRHTFTPLWLGYILVINALTYQRSGHCLLIDRSRHFLWLFVLSAGFWWFFEFLNRFVQNWHYVGLAQLTPAQYFFFATLSFSTVLPAVLSTAEWLATYPRLSSGLQRFIPVKPRSPKRLALAVLLLTSLGLLGIGIWPKALFPLVWIAPGFIVISFAAWRGRWTLVSPIFHGDWRGLWLMALAALVCGFFWEMWNSHSVTRWEYVLPFVHRFHIFEMPLLGYAGYLPFGLECAAVADFFLRGWRMTAPLIGTEEARLGRAA